MNKDHLFEIQANMDKWRREMAEVIEIAFLNSNNVHEFVREADERIKDKFPPPYSLGLETLYYCLNTIWDLGGQRGPNEKDRKLQGYEMAIDEVFKAYPLDIFPETTQAERDAINDNGFISRTSAMMGRHIAKVIRERAAHFAKELEDE